MTETPEQIAARLYPKGPPFVHFRRENDTTDKQRAAYLAGDAAGYARAIEAAVEEAKRWSVGVAERIRALSPASAAPDKEDR